MDPRLHQAVPLCGTICGERRCCAAAHSVYCLLVTSQVDKIGEMDVSYALYVIYVAFIHRKNSYGVHVVEVTCLPMAVGHRLLKEVPRCGTDRRVTGFGYSERRERSASEYLYLILYISLDAGLLFCFEEFLIDGVGEEGVAALCQSGTLEALVEQAYLRCRKAVIVFRTILVGRCFQQMFIDISQQIGGHIVIS